MGHGKATMVPTDDVVGGDIELMTDVFGMDLDDVEPLDGIEWGVVPVCSGEWRREPDGHWRFFREAE
jgi:hypothetical protein